MQDVQGIDSPAKPRHHRLCRRGSCPQAPTALPAVHPALSRVPGGGSTTGGGGGGYTGGGGLCSTMHNILWPTHYNVGHSGSLWTSLHLSGSHEITSDHCGTLQPVCIPLDHIRPLWDTSTSLYSSGSHQTTVGLFNQSVFLWITSDHCGTLQPVCIPLDHIDHVGLFNHLYSSGSHQTTVELFNQSVFLWITWSPLWENSDQSVFLDHFSASINMDHS